MTSINAPEFSRNYGFWNEEEQRLITLQHVAIGGVGGDGYQLGLKLARMGVANFTIADPEVFEAENINRVPGAKQSTLGRSKVDVFEEELRDINPAAKLTVFREGITTENVKEFMKDATIVFDETELTYLHLGTAIAREARRRNIPDVMVMNIGFAAQLTSFDPTSPNTFEKMMGIPADMSLTEVQSMKVDFSRCLPYVPPYSDLRTLIAINDGASLPSIAPGVDVASAIGSTEALKHFWHGANRRMLPTFYPRFRFNDSYNGKSGTIKTPRASHYETLVVAAANMRLSRSPEASYTLEAIEARVQKFHTEIKNTSAH